MKVYDTELDSRLWLGTARYPSPSIVTECIRASGCALVTVSLRRESGESRSGQRFWELIRELDVRVLPNTAGCHSASEAVTTARMAREVFGTSWIKLEVIHDDDTLVPEVIGLVDAAKILTDEGFQVFPYTTSDLSVADRLLDAGCRVLMPMGALLGSGQGLNDPCALHRLRERFSDTPLILDAGIGRPSHAVAAMEFGYDAVLLNTAVALAGDPVAMACAFAKAVAAGRMAYEAQPMAPRDLASASTPMLGRAWLD
ncbi:MAG: thiazole synthase [Gammaproteobacteria bacterium]